MTLYLPNPAVEAGNMIRRSLCGTDSREKHRYRTFAMLACRYHGKAVLDCAFSAWRFNLNLSAPSMSLALRGIFMQVKLFIAIPQL